MTDIQILKRLYKDYTKNYLNKIFLSVFFTVLLAGSTSAVAYLLDPAIEKLFINQEQGLIYIIPAFIVLAFAIKGASLYLAKKIMIGVSEEVRKDIQLDMFSSLIYADTKLVDSKHSGKFITNLGNDVGLITNFVSTGVLNLFKDSLTLIGLLTVMFYQNWKLSLLAIVMIPLASYAARALGKRMGKVTTQQMSETAKITTYLIDIFKNHKLAKIFQREEYEKKRAYEYITTLKEISKKISIVFVRASPIMEFLTGIMIAGLILIAAKLIASNELEISNFFSFLAAMMLAYQPVRSLATLNVVIQQGLSASRKVIPIIDEVPEIKEKPGSFELLISNGEIDFKNIKFNYIKNQNSVLNFINLKLPGKKMTALVGHSGAGKSTILNLIPRFYNADEGDIKIDNQSIYDCKISSLRSSISLVSQDTTLFDDTIKNNILYANPKATLEDMEEASKYSFADEFINKLPEKYDTKIGENGVRLSGGEKQRISIARAMLKKSSIILLDEATSSLDSETESKIQKALQLLISNRTTIVIAHRLSTILNSDTIYVIDKGSVIGSGSHKHLLENSTTYKNFYDKQLRKD